MQTSRKLKHSNKAAHNDEDASRAVSPVLSVAEGLQ